DGKLLLERLCFLKIAGALRLADLILQENFLLRDLRPIDRIDLRDLALLVIRQGDRRRIFLQALHRKFVGGFHQIVNERASRGWRVAFGKSISKLLPMRAKIRLLSTDFDGTLVSHASDPVFDHPCMELIRALQDGGAIWAINTGRSVDLLEEGLEDFSFPLRPDFILTSGRDVFRPAETGWEPYGDWNERCAQAHAELFGSASSVLAEVI